MGVFWSAYFCFGGFGGLPMRSWDGGGGFWVVLVVESDGGYGGWF